jgi:hypothetical protein
MESPKKKIQAIKQKLRIIQNGYSRISTDEEVRLATRAANILPTQATQVRPIEIQEMAIQKRANTKQTQ